MRKETDKWWERRNDRSATTTKSTASADSSPFGLPFWTREKDLHFFMGFRRNGQTCSQDRNFNATSPFRSLSLSTNSPSPLMSNMEKASLRSAISSSLRSRSFASFADMMVVAGCVVLQLRAAAFNATYNRVGMRNLGWAFFMTEWFVRTHLFGTVDM